jgi:hypothetical protein
VVLAILLRSPYARVHAARAVANTYGAPFEQIRAIPVEVVSATTMRNPASRR